MMKKSVLIVGPAGCGKTLHGEALRQFFGCSSVVDDWRPSQGLQAGALLLTQMQPGGAPLPYIAPDGSLEAYPFATAMQMMAQHHAAVAVELLA